MKYLNSTLIILIYLISTNLFAEIDHEISLGIDDEFYKIDDSNAYDGETPHAQAFKLNYRLDIGKEDHFHNLDTYYVFVDLGIKLEADAQLYDKTRDFYSTDSRAELLLPIAQLKKQIA